MSDDEATKLGRYQALIERVFFGKTFGAYHRGQTTVSFSREDLSRAAAELGMVLPKNLGDIVYSIRYRTSLPDRILATQPKGKEWVIEGTGRARYAFKLVRINPIEPNRSLTTIKIADATPEVIAAYALSDEQALLAKVRYNRLVDVFLGIAAYSLQNHLRTTVSRIGQLEIDEVYVGIDSRGRQYVLPVQAKGGSDRLSGVQTKQDVACCAEKFPRLICRPIAAQFMADDLIAMFELTVEDDEVNIVDERHYRLVPSDDISAADLKAYSRRS